MKVTLHIGSTKTGSSALQHHLYDGRAQLAKHRVFYPDIAIASNAHHLLAACIRPGAWGIHRDVLPKPDNKRAEWFRAYVAEIRRLAKNCKAKHVVLSSEYLWGVFPDTTYKLLAEAFAGDTLRIVGCVRRQDHWLESSYLQAVKNGNKEEFSDFLERFRTSPLRGADYLAVLDRYQTAIPDAEIAILPYEFRDRTAFTAAMIDFVTESYQGKTLVKDGAKSINRSPDANGLASLLRLNREDPKKPKGTFLANLLESRSRPENSGTTVILDPDSQQRILDENYEINRKLAERYARGSRPTLFDLGNR